MSFLNEPLSEERITKRRNELCKQLGLSNKCLAGLSVNSKSLCPLEKAKRRKDVLEKLGFDSEVILELNPTLLNRKSSTLHRRFNVVKAWFVLFNKHVNIHKLFENRPQLWSVGESKLFLNFLLAFAIKREVTPERFCNMITINLENVLLAYIDNPHADFVRLRADASALGNKVPVLDKRSKQVKIIRLGHKLPSAVFMYYQKYCIKK